MSGVYSVGEPLDLIDDHDGIAPAMGLSVHLMTAPAALIRAAARGDEVDGALCRGVRARC